MNELSAVCVLVAGLQKLNTAKGGAGSALITRTGTCATIIKIKRRRVRIAMGELILTGLRLGFTGTIAAVMFVVCMVLSYPLILAVMGIVAGVMDLFSGNKNGGIE